MGSLLGQFYSKIKGSQEDIASEGLVYILCNSEVARAEIGSIVATQCGIDLPKLTFKTQVSGKNLERPDISGYDDQGSERVIIEAKFWAALTANQPIEYLKRLSTENGVIMFVCPSRRERLLWEELTRLLKTDGIGGEFNNQKHVVTFENNRVLCVISWDTVLEKIKDVLMQSDERSLVSDIDQIIGFCQKIDDIAFLPIMDEDMSPSIGRRVSSYLSLMDKIIDELPKTITINLNGLRATPYRKGYVRYFAVGNLGLALDLNFEYWYLHAETPFWFVVWESTPKWELTSQLKLALNEVERSLDKKIVEINGIPHFPMYPERNTTEESVIRQMSMEIVRIIEAVSNRLELQAVVISS